MPITPIHIIVQSSVVLTCGQTPRVAGADRLTGEDRARRCEAERGHERERVDRDHDVERCDRVVTEAGEHEVDEQLERGELEEPVEAVRQSEPDDATSSLTESGLPRFAARACPAGARTR